MWWLAAGAALSAYGSLTGGIAGSRARREQARQQEEAARYARAAAAFEARRQRREDARTLGALRTSVAKAGLSFEGGSALAVYGESVRTAEENALAIVLAGELRARGLQAEARVARREASSAVTAGFLGAGTALFDAYGTYLKATR